MTATVTSKGQITIPKRVRDLLGIGPGSVVDFQRARRPYCSCQGRQEAATDAFRAAAWACRQRFEHGRDHGHDPRGALTLVLVDTNVLLDLVTDDPQWYEWSVGHLEEPALAGPVLINDIVYAEISIRYERIEDIDAMLAEAQIEVAPTPRAALFLAGKAFQRYRRARGKRTGVLPDFFIGAHAAVNGWHLLTRDVSRYRRYFPTVALIAPSP